MPTRGQLALIHIAVRGLHIADVVYRDMLYDLFHKNSSRDLTRDETSRLIAHLRELGWRPKNGAYQFSTPQFGKRKYEDLGRRMGMASPAQLRKVEASWMTGQGIHVKTPFALRHFLQHHFHVTDLRFVSEKQVAGILAAIRKMSARRGAN